ncbi:preprotein translocase subunit SecE [Fodinicola feengrottensis]|uniref:preprotein translocase subunit SecE n=1 Tax=Fodinicola feengrottensis TaxID=435914 RepID=UPI0031E46903
MAKGKGSAPADDEADAVLPDDTDTTQDDADAVDDSAEESGESRRSSDKSDRKSDRPKSKRGGGRTNPVSWVLRFVREVVAELGKVIWPTRKDLITYTLVVVVFLVVMVALVAGLDVGFERLALLVFGGGTSS